MSIFLLWLLLKNGKESLISNVRTLIVLLTCLEDPLVGHPTRAANDKALLNASLVGMNDQGC